MLVNMKQKSILDPNQMDKFDLPIVLNPKKVKYNWSKTNLLAYNHQIRYPQNEHDIQKILQESSSKIRIIGSGLSYEPIVGIIKEGPDALLLDIQNLKGFVKSTENTATFKAGTLLDDVYKYLIENNKILPCSPGVIGIQTIAGAISTGTHGQGIYNSALSDAVFSLRIVLPSSKIIEIDENDQNFGAFIMSMGCLGIITEVTFKTIPNKIFKCRKITTNYMNLLQSFEDINRMSQYTKAWWFSWTGEVHIWEVNDAGKNEIEIYEQNQKQLVNISDIIDDRMNETVDRAINKMGVETKDLTHTGKHFETVMRFKNVTDVVGNIYQILCKGIPAPQINCEIAIPYDKMTEVFEALNEWQISHLDTLHYPFILRCNGPSKAWLCPAYGKNVCYIGFLVYLAADGTFIKGSMEMMRNLQELLANYGGIPHLGKHFIKEFYDFPKLLPKWKDFIALKQELDPEGRFSNSFISSLFKVGCNDSQTQMFISL